MVRRVIISFLAAEATLYAAFLAIDLLGLNGPATALKYTGVLLCLVFSLWCTAYGGDRLVPPALLLTAFADLFLLVLDNGYAAGVLIFSCAQSAYLLRLRMASGKAWLPLRFGVPPLIGLVMFLLGQASPLNLLAALYFSQLLVNAVIAWTLPGNRWHMFAMGLTLFVGCDLCVGVFNSPGIFPDAIWNFSTVGMWLFYLPSQVLIALSALPEKEFSK